MFNSLKYFKKKILVLKFTWKSKCTRTTITCGKDKIGNQLGKDRDEATASLFSA